MKQLAGLVLVLLASGCSAVGYHGGAVTVTDGYFLEKKITPLSGRDVQITIWAHANSDGVLEQTLREEARAYGLRVLGSEDAILLCGDATYALRADTATARSLTCGTAVEPCTTTAEH